MAVLTAPRERDLLATDSPAVPTLRLIRRGDHERRTVPLSSGKYTVGSSPQCQICLPSPEVRPLQCLIALESGVAFVTRWATGAQLNGNEFSKSELNNGDRLTIGDWEITFDRCGSLDVASEPYDEADPVPISAPDSPPNLTADGAPVEPTPGEPAECRSSHAFADSLVLHLWTANDRARRRGKALITGIRAARFHADAMAADLSAMETELDLARAAHDSHLNNNDRLQQELAEQHEQRVAPLVEEIAALQSQLEEAQTHVSRRTAEIESLAEELAVLRIAAETPAVDPALVKRAEELEAAVAVHCQELEKVTTEFRLSQQEQQRLAELYRLEAERAAQESERAAVAAQRAVELEAAVAVHSVEREQLASDLRNVEQEHERLAALYQSEVERSAQEAERAAAEAMRSQDLAAVVAAHPHELERITGEFRQARQEQGRLLELYQTEAERAVQEATRATEAAKRVEELEAVVAAYPQALEKLTGDLRLAQQEQERLVELYRLETERAAQLEQQLSEQQAQIAAAVEQARAAASAAASAEQPAAKEDSWRDVAPTAKLPVAKSEPDACNAFTPQDVELNSPSPPDAGDVAEPEVAAPTPEAEKSAPEYVPASFIETYRHLLDADDGPATQATSPNGSRSMIDDEYLSPAKVETCASPSDESDDALEAYMANMMRRVRSSSPSYASSQVVPEDEPSAGIAASPTGVQTAYPPNAATDADSVEEAPLSLETIKQATRKQPLASDLAALREVANSTARTAIATHSQRRSRESAYGRIAIALTAMAAAAYLMASAPAITNWHFWAGLATCAVGITIAAQTLIVERRRTSDRAE